LARPLHNKGKEKMNKKLSRRDFLKMAGITSAGLALSACGVKAIDLPKATSIPPTGTSFPTETLTPTLTSTPTPPLEQLPQTKQILAEFVQAFQATETDISIDQLTQKGLEIRTIAGKDNKQYDIAFVHIEGTTQLNGDYPLLIKVDNEWEYLRPNKLDEIKGIPTIYVAGKYDEVVELNKISGQEFSGLSVEWAFHLDVSSKEEGNIDFGMIDYALGMGKKSGMTLATGATLLWDNGNLPLWIKKYKTKETLLPVLAEHITKVVKKYKGKIDTWTVVNEAYRSGYMNSSYWHDVFGEDTTWIQQAFITARDNEPNAELILNDFGIEFYPKDKYQEIFDLCKKLKEENAPIDGVGFQMHIYGSDLISGKNTFEQLQESIKQFMALGLDVHFTELDVDMSGYDKSMADKIREQGNLYYQIGEMASREGITSITIFGVKDDTSWLVESHPSKKETLIPLLFDSNFHKKVSYFCFLRGLLNGLQQ
jgi:endo-1,4-beta-xylanase